MALSRKTTTTSNTPKITTKSKPAKKQVAKKQVAKKQVAKKQVTTSKPAKKGAKKPARDVTAKKSAPATTPTATTRKTSLVTRLTDVTRDAFSRLLAEHGSEQFYFFALYTTVDGDYVVPTAWSEEALAAIVAKSSRGGDAEKAAQIAADYRFSAPDSPYHERHADAFDGLPAGRELHAACFRALQALDREGVFGTGKAREGVIVNVVYGDMSDQRWLEHARQLNPPRAIAGAAKYLRIPEPSGRTRAWGAGAYQVNAVSLSEDRKVLAYSGSGGDVGVYRLEKTPTPVFVKRRPGEHWASALSRDGRSLYLGDKSGILVLDPAEKGATRKLVKAGNPSAMVLSPNGELLAISSWNVPVTVFTTQGGRVVLRRTKKQAEGLAFSPGSDRLVVAGEQLQVIDVADGEIVAVYDTANGESWGRSVAWSPAGDLLVASSPKDGGIVLLKWPGLTPAKTAGLQAVINGLAFSPSGSLIAACVGPELIVYDLALAEVARGRGRQESVIDCVFLSERAVVAVGRDVNRGPAVLELEI